MDSIRIFFEQYAYYIVLVITLSVWSVLFFYILSIDKKLKKLEKE
ncbi:MAG: CcmD family protein [Chlorobi bacterium]|nr:CcmD family protein [Chlorobiota bacterium]MCI0715224.1 CcmD family protein [Chlorobiota bacterium]